MVNIRKAKQIVYFTKLFITFYFIFFILNNRIVQLEKLIFQNNISSSKNTQINFLTVH